VQQRRGGFRISSIGGPVVFEVVRSAIIGPPVRIPRAVRPRHMTPIEIEAKLGNIALRLGHLNLSHHDPEHFHVEKSELLREIGRLRENIRLGVNG
jgi:hypothetical protein